MKSKFFQRMKEITFSLNSSLKTRRLEHDRVIYQSQGHVSVYLIHQYFIVKLMVINCL